MTALREAIRGYQASAADFNKNAPDDDEGANAYGEQSYKPHLEVLNNWNEPAQNMADAIEALRISLTDNGGVYGCKAARAMGTAALGYLQSASAITPETSLYRLFSIYWERYAAGCEAMRRTDQQEHGSPGRDAAEAEQFAAGDHLEEVTYAICAFIPDRHIDARFKADFIGMLSKGNGGQLNKEELDALLSSLPDLVSYESREARL